MTRKRKKTHKAQTSCKNRSSTLVPEIQEQEIQALFAAKKYKEASERCKNLLKLEKRPEWLELLATIYSERSKELASKKMYKEAVMIWRNRAELCGKPLTDLFYFRILLAAGMVEQAFALYQQNSTELEQQGVLLEVREHLAALSLAQPSEILKTLPVDDMLVKDHPVALAALEAYCDGNDEILEDQLRAISFRSPFRDLRQILKALSLPENDTVAVTKLLARVPSSSPFIPLAEAVAASFKPDTLLFANIKKLNPQVTQFIATKRGLDSKLLKFTEELRQLGDSPSAEPLMRFVLRHRQTLGDKYARNIALRLLAKSPGCNSNFAKVYGKPSTIEYAKINAWKEELCDAYPLHIVEQWEDVEDLLTPEDCDTPDDYHLSLALISGHKLQQFDRLDDEMDISSSPLLEQILTHDPQDLTSYLRLISTYREHGELKQARHWLEQAMKFFPDDILILTEAVETALASNAYKKAAVLAKRILEKDPINTRVRTSLIDAHLSHTRKQIDNSKYSLAEKELDIAESWTRTEKDKARVDLVRGTWLLDQDLVQEASTLWMTAKEKLGGELCGHFYLLQELICQKRSATKALKKAKIKPLPKSIPKEQLLQLFHLLKKLDKSEKTGDATEALSMLTQTLSTGIKHKYSVSEFELICETTSHFNQHNLSLSFAKKACKQCPDELMFQYYKINAQTEINNYLSDEDYNRLHNLIEIAHENDDKRLRRRIEVLMDYSGVPPYFDIDNDLDEGPLPSTEDFIEMLFKMMPDSELKKLKKEMGESELREYAKNMIERDLAGLIDSDMGDNFDPFSPPPPKPKKKKKTKKESKPHSNKQLDLF